MKKLLIIAVLLAATVSAHAETLVSTTGFVPPVSTVVALHTLFADHMVLQRDQPVAVFGTAGPGGNVLVSFAGQSKPTTADAQGQWSVTLNAMAMSTNPATMTVTGLNTLTVDDIVVGDVWVCSGQSNMDFVMGAYGSPIFPEDYNVPLVRHLGLSADPSLSLQTNVDFHPISNPSGDWLVNSPTGGFMTAAGFYFARKVHLETGVPIGLIRAHAIQTKYHTQLPA